jgi:hypothetical protein
MSKSVSDTVQIFVPYDYFLVYTSHTCLLFLNPAGKMHVFIYPSSY